MQVLNGATLFSASDLVNFLECEHTTMLGLVDLVTPLPRAENDESNKLVQDKGFAHEESFLESLRAKGLRITEIPQHLPAEEAARATLEALADGPDIIFQAAFLSPPFYGRADFLRRVEGRSRFGDWQYEVMDTKLARSVKAKFVPGPSRRAALDAPGAGRSTRWSKAGSESARRLNSGGSADEPQVRNVV